MSKEKHNLEHQCHIYFQNKPVTKLNLSCQTIICWPSKEDRNFVKHEVKISALDARNGKHSTSSKHQLCERQEVTLFWRRHETKGPLSVKLAQKITHWNRKMREIRKSENTLKKHFLEIYLKFLQTEVLFSKKSKVAWSPLQKCRSNGLEENPIPVNY